MSYSNRIFLYGPLVLLLLIAAAVMIWWKIAAGAFDERLTAANGREIMPGVRMSYASKAMEGFPFRVDSVLDGFRLSVQMRTGPLVWRADHFAIHALTYGRDQQVFEAAGTQTFWWTDSDGARRLLTFVPGSLRASAILDHGRLARFDFDAVAVRTQGFIADRLQFHIRRAPGRDALEFSTSGDDVRDNDSIKPVDRRLWRQFSASGSVVPGTPFEPLLGANLDWRVALEAWRRVGGRVTVDQFDTQINGVHATGAGLLSLDDFHELRGQLNVSFVSWRPISQLELLWTLTDDYCKENTEWFRPNPNKTYKLTVTLGNGYAVCKEISPYTKSDEEHAPPPPGSIKLNATAE